MLNALPQIGADGFYHPSSEDDLIALVKQANASGLELRVRGSAHSVSCAIYTDSCTDNENRVGQQTPPSTTLNMNLMLDKYRGILNVDQTNKRVEVQAGINLGYNPSDPTHTSTLDNSLLYQIWNQYGWTLPDLGGISHQTVAGFISTGSSGGSLQFSINDAIYAIRLIDGQGNAYTVSRDDASQDLFNAAALSMGLLGVISTITFQCVETFNISGQEAISYFEDAAVDLFGDGDVVDGNKRPGLVEFLKEAQYSRFIWWPQNGGFPTAGQVPTGRVVIWQCQRMVPQPGFIPTRYQEFTNYPGIAELAESIFLTIVGNLDDIQAVHDILVNRCNALYVALAALLQGGDTVTIDPAVTTLFTALSDYADGNGALSNATTADAAILKAPSTTSALGSLVGDLSQKLESISSGEGVLDSLKTALLDLLQKILVTDVDTTIGVIAFLAPAIKLLLPDIFPKVLDIFVATDSTKNGMSKGEPQAFRDYGWSGLPMDNQADDVLMATEFTEIWLPLGRATDAMNLLKSYFAKPALDPWARLAKTGTYGWEFYAADATTFWMSPSYSNGTDEWKDGVFRIDPFWFEDNAGNPAEVFYPPLWNLLRDNGIPFRLHWGKFQPVIPTGDPEGWVAFFKSQYQQWDQFLTIRAEKDPNNIFLTEYWRSRFGLESAPAPKSSVTTSTSVPTSN